MHGREQTAPYAVTAAPQGRQAGEARPWRFSGAAWAVVWVVVGAAIGGMFVWALLSHELGDFAWLNSLLNLLPAALVGFVVATAIAALAAWWWLNRLVGPARGTLEQVVGDAAAATRAAAENDAAAAVAHAERALREAAAWYGPIAARRFVVQTSVTVLVTFGGLVGTGLLFRQTLLLGEQNQKLQEQTALLRDQNTKLDLQTVTAEAQRRAGLTVELLSILQTVSQMTPPNEAGERRTGPLQLPTGLVARVVAFSRAATRYWTAEVPDRTGDSEATVPRLADRPRSPERGQLLAGLVSAGVDVPVLARAGATFAYADLREAVLTNSNLSSTFLHGADLRGAVLRRASLFMTDLHGADLRGAILRVAHLHAANMSGADLRGADLGGADLRNANLRGADLTGADLRSTELQGAILRDTNLRLTAVGSDFTPGQLPRNFPTGWSAPPAGWEVFEDSRQFVRLRRVNGTSPEAPPAPSQ